MYCVPAAKSRVSLRESGKCHGSVSVDTEPRVGGRPAGGRGRAGTWELVTRKGGKLVWLEVPGPDELSQNRGL